MENIIDSPVAAGNSERQVAEEEDRSQAAARSYECAFCKRGFSNAQALGGHMNIHRKDKQQQQQRVKLKHSSMLLHIKTTDQSIDAIIPPPPTDSEEENMVTSPSNRQWPPWINLEKPQHLPLFAETASPGHRNREAGKGFSSGSVDEIRAGEELDLELRLGLGPIQQHSTAATDYMEKFF